MFNLRDLHNIEVALRLRAESCEDQPDDKGEMKKAKEWRKTHTKIVKLIAERGTCEFCLGGGCPECWAGGAE